MSPDDVRRWARRGGRWAAYGTVGVGCLLLSPLVILILWSPVLLLAYGPHSEPIRALVALGRLAAGG